MPWILQLQDRRGQTWMKITSALTCFIQLGNMHSFLMSWELSQGLTSHLQFKGSHRSKRSKTDQFKKVSVFDQWGAQFPTRLMRSRPLRPCRHKLSHWEVYICLGMRNHKLELFNASIVSSRQKKMKILVLLPCV